MKILINLENRVNNRTKTSESYFERKFPNLVTSSLPLILKHYTVFTNVTKCFIPFQRILKLAMFKFQSINFQCAST
jgi:hypothetical protein